VTQVDVVDVVCDLVDGHGAYASCREVAEEAGVPVEEAAPALARAHANGKLRRVRCVDEDGRQVWGWAPTDSGRDWLAFRVRDEGQDEW